MHLANEFLQLMQMHIQSALIQKSAHPLFQQYEGVHLQNAA